MKIINTNTDLELKKILEFIEGVLPKRDAKVLDIGCGFGRILKPLTQMGYDAMGIEISDQIRMQSIESNLQVISPEQFNKSNVTYDLIIMSHIIEHFLPSDLFIMMDLYIDKLKRGGFLIIATPLLTDYFYDDFDHIKSYTPSSIMNVFCNTNVQNRFRSRNKMKLLDIWFRRSKIEVRNYRSVIMGHSLLYKFFAFINWINEKLYFITFGIVAKKDGWVAIFKKIA